MPLRFVHLHPAQQADALNDEWAVLENTGPNDFVSKGCTLTVAKGKQTRGSIVGTLDPGFTLRAGEKICLVTGSPGKKVHGAPPEEKGGLRNYHLFLGGPVLKDSGTVLRLVLNQIEMAKATFDPASKDGLGKEPKGS